MIIPHPFCVCIGLPSIAVQLRVLRVLHSMNILKHSLHCFYYVVGYELDPNVHSVDQYPFYGIPAIIAVNMIMSCAAGGTLSIIIAVWAQASDLAVPVLIALAIV